MTSYPTRRRQRLDGFDYTTVGYYFVTLCVQGRLPLFGHVFSGQVERSAAGDAIEGTVQDLPSRFPGVRLDTLMIMPDHVHVILFLDGRTARLSEIVHWFKSQSTARYARGVREQGWKRFLGTLWQRGFYDRVIRTDKELNGIREYVLTNAVRWELRLEAEGGPTHALL